MKHTTSANKHKKSVRMPPMKDFDLLEGKALEPPELTTEEDIRFSSDILPPHDSAYTSELQYNGYEDIEDYDNNAYDLNVEKEKLLDPEQELNFEGRTVDPHTDEEEDPVRPQE